MRRVNKGDRFYHHYWGLWEATGELVVSHSPYGYYGILIDNAANNATNRSVYDIWNFDDEVFWEFRGNYNKQDNFETLYNLLNTP